MLVFTVKKYCFDQGITVYFMVKASSDKKLLLAVCNYWLITSVFLCHIGHISITQVWDTISNYLKAKKRYQYKMKKEKSCIGTLIIATLFENYFFTKNKSENL